MERAKVKTGPILRGLGIFLIVLGVALNEWVIKGLSGGQAQFAEVEKRVFLAVVELGLMALGWAIYRYGRVVLVNLALVAFSVLLTLGGVEFALTRLPSNLEEEAPKWIPYAQKMANLRINEVHEARARGNRHGFNDRDHALKKAPGTWRIAVLGDSFVWGVGVEASVIWTRKLERIFNENGYPCEILHWGKPGWSTLDQYHFLTTQGIDYEFDLLLVGFVVNDPMMDPEANIKRFIYDGGLIDRVIVRPLSRYLFPNTISLFVDLTNAFFDSHFGYGYANWLKKVYSAENLAKYQGQLDRLAGFCRERRIELLIVMTPENHHPSIRERFAQVIPMFQKAGIAYLDLYPAAHDRFRSIPNRKLWANPADGHPGDAMTDLYAWSAYRYLIGGGYLTKGKGEP